MNSPSDCYLRRAARYEEEATRLEIMIRYKPRLANQLYNGIPSAYLEHFKDEAARLFELALKEAE